MPQLVTLSAAPYNPYNDTFARFAMQGLKMGMQNMQFQQNLAQRQTEHQSSVMSDMTKNLFRGVEMQMQRKELDHRIENDKFNNALKQEELGMRKEAFSWDKEKFWAGLSMDKRKLDLNERQFGLDEKRLDYGREQDLFMRPIQLQNSAATAVQTAVSAQTLGINQEKMPSVISTAKSSASQAEAEASMAKKKDEATSVQMLEDAQKAHTEYMNAQTKHMNEYGKFGRPGDELAKSRLADAYATQLRQWEEVVRKESGRANSKKATAEDKKQFEIWKKIRDDLRKKVESLMKETSSDGGPMGGYTTDPETSEDYMNRALEAGKEPGPTATGQKGTYDLE